MNTISFERKEKTNPAFSKKKQKIMYAPSHVSYFAVRWQFPQCHFLRPPCTPIARAFPNTSRSFNWTVGCLALNDVIKTSLRLPSDDVHIRNDADGNNTAPCVYEYRNYPGTLNVLSALAFCHYIYMRRSPKLAFITPEGRSLVLHLRGCALLIVSSKMGVAQVCALSDLVL